MKMMKRLIGVLLIVLWVVACNTSDNELRPPEQSNILGFVEVSFSGIGTEDFAASAKVIPAAEISSQDAPTLVGNNAGIQIADAGARMSSTDANNNLNLFATFNIRNADVNGNAYNTARNNVSFLAVDTASTISDTAVSDVRPISGAAYADPAAIARAVKPSVGLNAGAVQAGREDFQAFLETEITALNTQLGAAVTPFPYGFVVRCVSNCTAGSRTLPASPGVGVFDGQVTFAVTVAQPDFGADANKPHFLRMIFVIVDDADARVTQDINEYGTTGAETRADALGTAEIALLGNAWLVPTGNAVQRICSLRTAGQAGAPTATLIDHTAVPGVCATQTTVTQNRMPGAAIPDNGLVTDTMTIATAGKIHDLDVTLDITHAFVGDLIVALKNTDTNVYVPLVYRPFNNNCNGDDIKTILDDETTGVANGTAIDFDCVNTNPGNAFPNTHYRPSVPLSVFDGENINGNWELRVRDGGTGTTGILNGWTITAQVSTPGPGELDINAASLNDDVYITQAVQSLKNNVPLIKNRTAQLRAFFTQATMGTTNHTSAKLYGFINGAPIDGVGNNSIDLTGNGTVYPTAVDESSTTYGAAIPAAWLADGLQVYLEVVTGANTQRFPASGVFTPKLIASPQLPITLKSYTVQGDSDGNAANNPEVYAPTPAATDAAAQATYFEDIREMLRIEDIAVTIAATANLDCGAGITNPLNCVLTQVGTDRLAAGDANTRNYWHAIVNVTQDPVPSTSGDPQNPNNPPGDNWGGLAATPGFRGATDIDQGALTSEFVFHELGHNFTRFHVGGICGSTGLDPEFPHGNGIGTWGFNVLDNTDVPLAKNPQAVTGFADTNGHQDIMGYCGNQWLSDYNFLFLSNFLAEQSVATAFPTQKPLPSSNLMMIVGGVMSDGQLSLNPAFQVRSEATPNVGGRYAFELLDAQGSVLKSVGFNMTLISDAALPTEMFHLSIPVDQAMLDRVHEMRVVDSLASQSSAVLASRSRGLRPQAVVAPRAARVATDKVNVSYDAAAYEQVIVRDIDTGETIAVGQSGNIDAWTSKSQVEVILTDGIISQTMILDVGTR